MLILERGCCLPVERLLSIIPGAKVHGDAQTVCAYGEMEEERALQQGAIWKDLAFAV